MPVRLDGVGDPLDVPRRESRPGLRTSNRLFALQKRWLGTGPSREVRGVIVGQPVCDKTNFAAVENFLIHHGYAKSSDGKPDFLVDIHLAVEKMIEVDQSGDGWPGHRYFGDSAFETIVIEYDEGTVIIDFLDAGTQRLFWRGTGTRRINHSSSPKKSADTINRWVSEILKQYPPKTKVSRQTPAGCSASPNQVMPAAPQV